ncbi:hypothetical protein Fmac_008337 [Flemingia macrophylla]|uniref:Uncharacterized protein n=1 Tax=Flemingia macrophylla TaxID=520843 RepID=A0ABD1MXY8_9FABA
MATVSAAVVLNRCKACQLERGHLPPFFPASQGPFISLSNFGSKHRWEDICDFRAFPYKPSSQAACIEVDLWLVEFAFEICALEDLLEAICSFLDSRTTELETPAYLALDELTFKQGHISQTRLRVQDVFAMTDSPTRIMTQWNRNNQPDIANKNAANRAKLVIPHILGSKTLARKMDELETIHGREFSRVEMYQLSHKKPDGTFVNEEARELHQSILFIFYFFEVN